jgi:hypothetical protein
MIKKIFPYHGTEPAALQEGKNNEEKAQKIRLQIRFSLIMKKWFWRQTWMILLLR